MLEKIKALLAEELGVNEDEITEASLFDLLSILVVEYNIVIAVDELV